MRPEPKPRGLAGRRTPALLFLDLDDVLCLNEPYGGLHAYHAARSQGPADFYPKVFRHEAVDALNVLLEEFTPGIVMTSSWLALLQQSDFINLFRLTGLERVAANFHPVWDAAADRGVSRLTAIDLWLERNLRGESYLILDDLESGESLVDSRHDKAGRVVFCDVSEGFHHGLLPAARDALRLSVGQAGPS